MSLLVASTPWVWNQIAPASSTIAPGTMPPRLWAVFQMETMLPRSLLDHQCTIVLPHGGQPMPWNQPLMKIMQKAMNTPEVAHGIRPIIVMHMPDSSRPSGRNTLGLERSDTVAIRNFDSP